MRYGWCWMSWVGKRSLFKTWLRVACPPPYLGLEKISNRHDTGCFTRFLFCKAFLTVYRCSGISRYRDRSHIVKRSDQSEFRTRCFYFEMLCHKAARPISKPLQPNFHVYTSIFFIFVVRWWLQFLFTLLTEREKIIGKKGLALLSKRVAPTISVKPTKLAVERFPLRERHSPAYSERYYK